MGGKVEAEFVRLLAAVGFHVSFGVIERGPLIRGLLQTSTHRACESYIFGRLYR